MVFSGGEEYMVVGKRNVQISFGRNILVFLNVHYVPRMELNLLSVNQIRRYCPQLSVNFSNHKFYIVNKEN